MPDPLRVWVLSGDRTVVDRVGRGLERLGVRAEIRQAEEADEVVEALRLGAADVVVERAPKRPIGAGSGGEPGLARLIEAVSHELRNHLNAVGNAAQVLSFQAVDAPMAQRRTIEFLDQQCRVMAGLLDDCGEIARLASGRVESHARVVELGSVLSRALGSGSSPVAAGPRLDVAGPPVPVWVDLDVDRLERAIQHAVSFSSRTRPRPSVIRVDWRVGPDWVELAMRPEPFPAEGESPVGPAAVIDRFFAEVLGGRLGGRFEAGPPAVLRLPRLPNGRQAPSPAVGPGATPEGADRLVLLVDDSLEAVRGLGTLLARSGCRVQMTSDVDCARRIVREDRPDLVLIDVLMPDLDGRDLARSIRADHPEGCPTLVGITGSDLVADPSDPRERAFDRILHKPVRLGQVLAMFDGHPDDRRPVPGARRAGSRRRRPGRKGS